MVRKLFVLFLALAIVACYVPIHVRAEVAAPKSLDAPEHFAVSHYYGDAFYFSLSAPDDMRAYMDALAKEDPVNGGGLLAHFQIDYKIDNGTWQYQPEWDSPATFLNNTIYVTLQSGEYYSNNERYGLSSLFQENEELEEVSELGWNYFNSHAITFRARFAQTFDYGQTLVCSDWSEEYTLSSKPAAAIEKKIQYAPILLSADVGLFGGEEPYLEIRMGKVPAEVQKLSAMSGSTVRTEIWMRRKGEKEFKYIHYEWANHESFRIEASDYFKDTEQSYDEQSYEIKARYSLDMENYKQAERSDEIAGPYSNVIAHNMPAWSKTSNWAEGEIQKAVNNNLYPEKLEGADLTRPVTRAEFAAVALKLYEALSGKTAEPAPANTFTDTKDTDILKAYALDIVAGVGNNKFAPDEYVNREQAATMLTRVYKKLKWEGWTLAADSTYNKHSLDSAGVASFADDAHISGWAKPSVYFMAKYEIIKGLGGNRFAPKNTTSAETAAGYANATREQALALSNRTYEKIDTIKDNGPISAAPTSQPEPTKEPAEGSGLLPSDNPDSNDNATNLQASPVTDAEMEKWLIGFWGTSDSAGANARLGTGVFIDIMYEFRKDGTFYKIVSSLWNFSRSATAFEGKYRVSGNQLLLTGQLKSTGGATTAFDGIWYLAMDRYDTKDVPHEDAAYTITRTDKDTLIINDSEYSRGLSNPFK